MTVFEEGYLRFEFGDTWQVLKYDAHKDYLEKVQKLRETKAVDFTAMCNGNLFLIEVKDLRAHRIENKDRLDGPLWEEVALKVRDTIAGVIAAHRTSSIPEQWSAFARCLADRGGRLRVILWLEDDTIRGLADAQARATVLTKALKVGLRWLTPYVIVANRHCQGTVPPDVTITNLPGAAGHAGRHN